MIINIMLKLHTVPGELGRRECENVNLTGQIAATLRRSQQPQTAGIVIRLQIHHEVNVLSMRAHQHSKSMRVFHERRNRDVNDVS
jgi:hypothetical protein